MERKKIIKMLGLGLMIICLFLMAFNGFEDSTKDTRNYMSMGLVGTVIGLFLVMYGSKKAK